MHRVAIIFDDQLRPETTGVYCLRALGGLVEVEHIRPTDLPRLHASTSPRLNDFDLFLHIDDGLDYRLPAALRPAAWWAIDTHLDFERCLAKAREFDIVFAAQRDGAERLLAEGIRSAVWLPLACDPAVHRKHDVAKQFDVCFVGNEFPGERTELVRLIQRKFLNTFVGRQYFDDMARTYSSSRIVFNRSVRNDVNMRVFEVVACGSLLLTNDLSDNGQSELFRSGVHLETYREADELIDKIRYYLAHDDVRERIAAAGRAEALAHHTYRHRMEVILQRVQGSGVRIEGSGFGVQGSGTEQLASTVYDGTERAFPPRLGRFSTASTPSTLPRDRSYFDHARPELLALIPSDATRVLDVGCGGGRLGEAIKQRQTAHVTGIELNDGAAEQARNRLDAVVVGNVEEMELTFDRGSFDCIVCGDILEHLEDAERVLTRIRSWLRPDGCLVASIPNVRHHSILRSLLDGNWTYEAAGLLDRDHVRFFTRREIEQMFRDTGFAVKEVQFVPGAGYEEWQQHGRPGAVRVGRLHVGGLAPEQAEEFYIYQFLVVAVPLKTNVSAERVADGRDSAAEHRSATNRNGRRNVNGRMRFTQNFITDFDQFDFWGQTFAFVRFGDGERAICAGEPVECRDGWKHDGSATQFAEDLNASLRFNNPDYYIGISDGCCDRRSRDWFLSKITAPMEQVTFANIFVNWNYRRFRQLELSGTFVVSSAGGDLTVPDDLVTGEYDIDAIVDQLLHVDRPILLAAGPASCIIAHKYWLRAEPHRRQAIVDVGSAIDEWTKGRKTRQYQFPGSGTAERICAW
jgi:2-polyprenyl-3-methyl-5-hydroxy-6-metoxy-1,4-benzoquinol methylase